MRGINAGVGEEPDAGSLPAAHGERPDQLEELVRIGRPVDVHRL